MLIFREVTSQDRAAIHTYFYGAVGHGSEYSFANLIAWGEARVCFVEGVPLILSRFGSWQAYLYPLNAKFLPLLREDARERGIKFRIWGLTAQEVASLSSPDLSIKAMRNSFDYVYDIERLCELRGKKLQSKRNHCNRFALENPDHKIVELTNDLLPQCKELAKRWFVAHEEATGNDYSGEKCAMSKVFAQFEALQMEGLALLCDGEIAAFCMGNRIRKDMFDVNYEKALADIHGAYPTINRAFARYIHAKYPEIKWINREDDMGLEGLRKAKESYYPDLLLEKFVAEEIL